VARFYREKLRAEGWKEERALGQRAMEKVMSRVKGLNEEVAILLFYRKNDSLLINVATVPKPSCTSPNMLKRSLVIVARNMEREMPKLEKKELQKELRSRKGGKL
jgi:hypothetical protein